MCYYAIPIRRNRKKKTGNIYKQKMKCYKRNNCFQNIQTIKKWNPIYDFAFFFKLFSVSSLMFGICGNNPRKQKWLRKIEIIANIILFYCLLIPLRVNIQKSASTIYICCALATVLFLLLLRISLFMKREEILSVAEEISTILKKISDTKYNTTDHTRNWIVLFYFSCIIIAIFMDFTEIYNLYVDDQGSSYQNVIAADLNMLLMNNEFFETMLGIIIIFNNYVAYMTYLSSLLFCCIFYKFLQKLFFVFGQKLSENKKILTDMEGNINFLIVPQEYPVINKSFVLNSGREISDFLMEKIDQFNNLKSVATKVDSITSVVALCLISLAITSLFETQSFSILAKGNLERQKILFMFEISMLFLAFVVVASLSFCASNVSQSFEKTVLTIRKFTSSLSMKMSPKKTKKLILMLIFVNNSNTTKIHMTGWQIFNINKSLILTVAGGLVTYGVIINQMMIRKENT